MKSYVIVTGTVFGLIVLAHVWRAMAEGPKLAKESSFLVSTAAAAALALWAWRVFRALPKS